jgi:hypothetical protein
MPRLWDHVKYFKFFLTLLRVGKTFIISRGILDIFAYLLTHDCLEIFDKLNKVKVYPGEGKLNIELPLIIKKQSKSHNETPLQIYHNH